MKRHSIFLLFAIPFAAFLTWSDSLPADPFQGLRYDIFVSAQEGSDSWSGALPGRTGKDGPLQTFDRARQRVQEILQASPHLREVHVQFRGGIYFLPATEQFSASDSGSPNVEIFYENYPNERPVISGGMRLVGWTQSGANTWTIQVPRTNFENLYYISRHFEDHSAMGERRLRPRLAPLGSAPSYVGGYLRVVGQVTTDTQSNQCPISSDPNTPTPPFTCIDRFIYKNVNGSDANDPITSTWKNLTAPSPAPSMTCLGNPASTAPVGDIELVDFEQYSVAKLRVACVDTANGILYLTGPTAFEMDHQTANGFLVGHRYLVENVEDALTQPGQWFLDRTDPTWTLTYLSNPDENPNQDLVIIPQLKQVLVASDLQYVTFRGLTFAHDDYVVAPPSAAGTDGGYNGLDPIPAAISFHNSSHITFDSNVVTQTAGTGLEFLSCLNPQSGNAYLCTPFDASAVTEDNIIENNTFVDLGANALRIGMSGQSADSASNIPQSNTVINNVIEGYGRVFPGSTGIEQGDASRNLYTHNEIYDGYKGAIHICFCNDSSYPLPAPLANNNVVSFNLAHNLFQGIMNDSGSLYFGVGTPNSANPNASPPIPAQTPATATGNRLLNNVVHDVTDASIMDSDGYGGDGLYLDDFTGAMDVENNLVYRVSDASVSFSGPRPPQNNVSTVRNNIFAFARRSLITATDPYSFKAPSPSPLFFDASYNLFYFDRDENSTSPLNGVPTYSPFFVQGGCAFAGGPYTGFQLWYNNLYYRADRTFLSDSEAFHIQPTSDKKNTCPDLPNPLTPTWQFYYFSQVGGTPDWQALGEDANSIIRNPLFRNPAYPFDDYSLLAGAPPMPGFKVFDPHQAGLIFPRPNVPPVPATFPTATYNPATDF
jgi:hypothetical protein